MKIIFITKMILPLNVFICYLGFYNLFASEISLIPPHKINSNVISSGEIFEFGSYSEEDIINEIYKSKYSKLFFPLIKSADDKSDTEDDPLLSKRALKQSSKNKLKEPKLSFLYVILPVIRRNVYRFEIDAEKIFGYLEFLLNLETPSTFQKTIKLPKNTLAKAIYGGKACYVISAIIESPKTISVNAFFKKLKLEFPKFSIEEMETYFEISRSESLKLTFDDFLHSDKSSRKNISKYRDVSETCGIQYNRSDPIYILKTMIGWRSLKFDGIHSSKKQDLGVKVKNLNLILLNCAHIKQHFFGAQEIKFWMELPYILNSFNLNWQSRHFWKSIQLRCESDVFLQQSLAVKAFNQRFNLETLETLGDSILKFLVSFYLYIRFDDCDESVLTQIR
jgi:hypothetical protein